MTRVKVLSRIYSNGLHEPSDEPVEIDDGDALGLEELGCVVIVDNQPKPAKKS